MSKITNDGLTRSGWHRMLYSCTGMAPVCVKGLIPLCVSVCVTVPADNGVQYLCHDPAVPCPNTSRKYEHYCIHGVCCQDSSGHEFCASVSLSFCELLGCYISKKESK